MPGISWTANQRPPSWWSRYKRAQEIKNQVLNKSLSPKNALGTLAEEARKIMDCEIVSIFSVEPPLEFISVDIALSEPLQGSLCLQVESHESRGLLVDPCSLILPLTSSGENKTGLTAAVVRALPFGHVTRLHGKWLHQHPQVRNWKNHDHLTDRSCHSFASITVITRIR